MNEKPFFEVFRTLQVDGQLHSLFEQVMVTRVSTNPGRDVLRSVHCEQKADCKRSAFSYCKTDSASGLWHQEDAGLSL